MGEPGTDRQPLHDVVRAILADFASGGGPEPAPDLEAMKRWRDELRRHPQRERIGRELVVVAMRARREGALVSMMHTVMLAAFALGDSAVRRQLEADGLDPDTADRLVRNAVPPASPLAAGLSAPNAAGVRGPKTRS